MKNLSNADANLLNEVMKTTGGLLAIMALEAMKREHPQEAQELWQASEQCQQRYGQGHKKGH